MQFSQSKVTESLDPLRVDFNSAGDVLKLYPEVPLLSSDRAGWDGIQLQYHRHPPHRLDRNYARQHRIIIHDRSPSPPFVEETIEHRFQTKQFSDGDVTFVPANVLNSATWDTEYQFITLSFDSSTFVRHTFDLTTRTDVEFLPSFSKSDPLIHGIGLAFRSELEPSGIGSRLYIDSLTTVLMNHLLQNKMSIAEVAFMLGFTHQSHLSRHFKRLVGVTPKVFMKSQ